MTRQHPLLRTLLQTGRLWLLAAAALLSGATALAGSPSMRAAPESAAVHAVDAPPEAPGHWMSLQGVYVRLHAHPDDRATARSLFRHAEEAVPRIAAELKLPAGRTMDIYLAPDDETFNAMQPGAPPDWADGTAWPHRGLIFLHSPRARDGTATAVEKVLEHEIVHIVLGRAFGPRVVPRWLQEGTAQLLAREYTPDITRRLAGGVLGDNLLTLADITSGFPQDPIRAQLAYAQSADLVAYLRNTWGTDAFAVLVREMAAGRSVEAAIRKATGKSAAEVDRAWRWELEQSGLWLQPLVSDTMLLGGAAVFFVMTGALALRRRRRKDARRSRDEAIHDAVYENLSSADWGAAGLPPRHPKVPQRWTHPEPDLVVH